MTISNAISKILRCHSQGSSKLLSSVKDPLVVGGFPKEEEDSLRFFKVDPEIRLCHRYRMN